MQLSEESYGAEAQRQKDWVNNGSLENGNQSQLNVADASLHVYASKIQIPMGTLLTVNAGGVKIKNATSNELAGDPTPMFLQQSSATWIAFSMPVKKPELKNTTLAPSLFHFPLVNPRKNVKNCKSNPVKAFRYTYFHFTTDNDRHHCNATPINCTDYHK